MRTLRTIKTSSTNTILFLPSKVEWLTEFDSALERTFLNNSLQSDRPNSNSIPYTNYFKHITVKPR